MGIAFLTANYFFTKEIKRKTINETVASGVVMISLIGGIAGSKLFSLLENWHSFIEDPIGEIFSPAGLTFYGGLIVASLSILIYLKIKKGFIFKDCRFCSPFLNNWLWNR